MGDANTLPNFDFLIVHSSPICASPYIVRNAGLFSFISIFLVDRHFIKKEISRESTRTKQKKNKKKLFSIKKQIALNFSKCALWTSISCDSNRKKKLIDFAVFTECRICRTGCLPSTTQRREMFDNWQLAFLFVFPVQLPHCVEKSMI